MVTHARNNTSKIELFFLKQALPFGKWALPFETADFSSWLVHLVNFSPACSDLTFPQDFNHKTTWNSPNVPTRIKNHHFQMVTPRLFQTKQRKYGSMVSCICDHCLRKYCEDITLFKTLVAVLLMLYMCISNRKYVYITCGANIVNYICLPIILWYTSSINPIICTVLVSSQTTAYECIVVILACSWYGSLSVWHRQGLPKSSLLFRNIIAPKWSNQFKNTSLPE